MNKAIGLKRLRGPIPKIGIRPTIDGRRMGVRESLEDQTMNLAKTVETFLVSNLKHPNGMNVECVVPDYTIGGVAEAAECDQLFKSQDVGLSITVTPCWCYGTETVDMDPLTPKAIFGFNGTERPGAVYLAAALAGHTQKGVPAFGVYGNDVLDAGDNNLPDDVKAKLLRFAKAGLAVAWMKGKSYLSLGGVSMGIAGSIVTEDLFQNWLGMRNEYVDMSEIARRLKLNIFDPEEYELALKWTKENCKEGADINPPEIQKSKEEKDVFWENSVKMTIICKDLMIGNPKLAPLGFGEEALGHNAIAAGFQGQRHWTDHMTNADFLESILNTSFDWSGLRQPYIMATENDNLNGVAMLFGHLLTNTAQIFSDVRTYWSFDAVKRVTGHELTGIAKDGLIHLINSGSSCLDGTGQQSIDGKPAIKPFWDITEEEVDKCLKSTLWPAVVDEYFRGGGFSSQFLTLGDMPITMSRVNIVKGLGPVLQLSEGYTVSLPKDVNEILDKRTNETWPTTWFVPRLTGKGAFTSVYEVMNHWGANHGAVSYGHIGADLITLASMLRIPVNMHNVPYSDIFRPSAWNSFGTEDLEGADFRACSNFGPIY
jgi:L-fucose/D-arabinose isomerase